MKTTTFDPSKPKFRVFSFGAGVQTMALLYAWLHDSRVMKTVPGWEEWEGFFDHDDVPDLVCFADTKAEPPAVYAAVEDARALCEEAGVPFAVVSYGDLAHPSVASTGTQGIFTPVFTTKLETDEGGPAGKEGQLLRQCTGRYKIDPIMEYVKPLAGNRPIEIVLGISLEEAHRMKRLGEDSQVQYRYPLIYQDRLGTYTRNDCANYLRDLDLPPVKSACVFCPYKSDARWVDLYKNDPESFAKAVAYDEWVRDQRPGYKCWVHRSRTPLLDAVLALVAIAETQTTLFETDADMSASGGCEEGYCGL